jgi:hypothetical protein
MINKLGRVGISLFLLAAAACSGEDGAKGVDGTKGETGGQGAPGVTGPAGANGTAAASFSVIEPRVGLLGREFDIVISAQAATFDTGAKIDFGDAQITVTNVKAVSPTTLYAHVKVDNGAKIGPKDVTIGKIVGTGAFEVKPAIEVKIAGLAQQGSIIQVELTNNDNENPFDTNTFALATPPGLVPLGGQAATAKKASFGLLIEPTATVGALQIAGTDAAGTMYLSSPTAIPVKANTPVALAGTKDEVFKDAFDTKLYKYATTDDAIVSLHVVTTDPSAVVPQAILLPASGKVDDLLTVISAPPDPDSWLGEPLPPPYDITMSYPVPKGANDAFVMLSDLAAAQTADSKLAFTLTTTPATSFAEAAAAHVDVTGAQSPAACIAAGALKPCLIAGEIKAADEVDTYKIEGLTADTALEVSLQSAAGVSVYAIDFAKGSVKSTDSKLESPIKLTAKKSTPHVASSVTTAALKSWVIVVKGDKTMPLGKYSLGLRAKN